MFECYIGSVILIEWIEQHADAKRRKKYFTRMNIGIDLRPLQAETRYRGIGKTLEFFLAAAAKYLAKDTVVFYAEADEELPQIIELFPRHVIKHVPRTLLGNRRYFRSFMSGYRSPDVAVGEIDVFLQFDIALGIPKHAPTVLVYYDLIPLIFRKQEKVTFSGPLLRRPKDMLAGYLYWHKYLRLLKQYRKASQIISISENSRDDLLRLMPYMRKVPITVAPLGVDKSFFMKPKLVSKAIENIGSKHYLLYVGGIDTRKNIVELLHVLFTLKPVYPDLRLVVVGKEFSLKDHLESRGWYKELKKHKEYEQSILSAGYVSHDELLYLYSRAVCFVFPSVYEGFGLPILEAMAANCPVVAYKTSSIPEVAGSACELVDPGLHLDEAVRSLLADNKKRTSLIKRGRKHAEAFTWDATAEAILSKVYEYGNSK